METFEWRISNRDFQMEAIGMETFEWEAFETLKSFQVETFIWAHIWARDGFTSISMGRISEHLGLASAIPDGQPNLCGRAQSIRQGVEQKSIAKLLNECRLEGDKSWIWLNLTRKKSRGGILKFSRWTSLRLIDGWKASCGVQGCAKVRCGV